MTDQNGPTRHARQPPEWQLALDDLERALMEANQAVAQLRRCLNGTYREPAPAEIDAKGSEAEADVGALEAPGAELPSETSAPAESEAPEPERPPEAAGPAESEAPAAESEATPRTGRPGTSAFDRLWERIEHERIERTGGGAPQEAEATRRGLDLLPQQYLMTVEDREGRVDMVPLHRALSQIRGVEDISLVSYANGVPVISVRAVGELDLDQLGGSVSTAMDRECEVIPQDNGRVYLRMKARE